MAICINDFTLRVFEVTETLNPFFPYATAVRGNNFTILISDPLWAVASSVTSQFDITDYTHEIAADGGMISASGKTNISSNDIAYWIESGLGKHVQVFDYNLDKIFLGFINRLTITIGGISIVVGPLIDIANRVKMNYTPIIDLTKEPPVNGSTISTTFYEDIPSQQRYGIIERILSGGTLQDADTILPPGSPVVDEPGNIIAASLQEFKKPTINHELNSEGDPLVSLEVEISGYSAWLNLFTYYETDDSFVTITEKLINIISQEPNGVFSTNQDGIENNDLITIKSCIEDKTAQAVIDEELPRGDANEMRWVFGLEVDQNDPLPRIYYKPVPSQAAYYYHLAIDGRYVITTDSGLVIEPQRIKPGEFIFFADVLIGKETDLNDYDSLINDPRVMFIERVTFSLPNKVEFTGSRLARLTQIMANKGLGDV